MTLQDEIARAAELKAQIQAFKAELDPLETRIKAQTIASIIENTAEMCAKSMTGPWANANPKEFLLIFMAQALRDANALIVPNTGADFSEMPVVPFESYVKALKP
jgi:hypothetical protein